MKRKLKEEKKENRKLTKWLAAGEKKAEKDAKKIGGREREQEERARPVDVSQRIDGKAKTTAKQADDPVQLRRQLDDEVLKNMALTTENEMLRGLLEEKEGDRGGGAGGRSGHDGPKFLSSILTGSRRVGLGTHQSKCCFSDF